MNTLRNEDCFHPWCHISIVISIESVVCTGEQTGWKEVWRRALGRIGIRNKGYFVLEKKKFGDRY